MAILDATSVTKMGDAYDDHFEHLNTVYGCQLNQNSKDQLQNTTGITTGIIEMYPTLSFLCLTSGITRKDQRIRATTPFTSRPSSTLGIESRCRTGMLLKVCMQHVIILVYSWTENETSPPVLHRPEYAHDQVMTERERYDE